MSRSLYIGLMSGTSLDGVDVALVDFAAAAPATLATHFAPFEPGLRNALLELQSDGAGELERAARAANGLAHAYAAGVTAVLAGARLGSADVRAIGAHGQTVRHRPADGYTIQLNNPALLAELTGIDVIADFRSRDVAAHGQGAPLAPAFHRAFFAAPDRARAVVNIGGIANATLIDAQGGVTGFDTGPGNVLMDLWCARHTGRPYDAAGAWAAGGKVVPGLLAALRAEPYFGLPIPKSTGRDLFNEAWLTARLDGQAGASAQDVQTTLLELTATSIADALRDSAADTAFLCGGGAHNAALRQRLAALAAPMRVATTDALGVPPDWVEAVAFAWLAREFVAGTPLDLRAVTGAAGPRRLGALYPA